MKKGYIPVILLLTVLLAFSSCKRRWMCSCTFVGAQDTVVTRELRGYNKRGANEVCKSDEYSSNGATTITCNVY
ncbi:MAG: hypothetical protein H6551_13545 [Chitinophagales bacterium]|nr:hypothetical protein [Chitinophagaceae bacterium]MCB9066158.1 hypothetical protein [Chitinophagales bacterium]